ncbi:MAG: hypothetical protein AVDCRST_MAG57-1392, partial [uncultured Blastococcus sp.]
RRGVGRRARAQGTGSGLAGGSGGHRREAGLAQGDRRAAGNGRQPGADQGAGLVRQPHRMVLDPAGRATPAGGGAGRRAPLPGEQLFDGDGLGGRLGLTRPADAPGDAAATRVVPRRLFPHR